MYKENDNLNVTEIEKYRQMTPDERNQLLSELELEVLKNKNYCVENTLSMFEFHDSRFSLTHFDGQNLLVSAAMVNVHKNTTCNPSNRDMEIANALILFKHFRPISYESDRTQKLGEDGLNLILDELKHSITVLHFEKEPLGFSIGGIGKEPYFTMEFDFDEILVGWDEYASVAWYESHP